MLLKHWGLKSSHCFWDFHCSINLLQRYNFLKLWLFYNINVTIFLSDNFECCRLGKNMKKKMKTFQGHWKWLKRLKGSLDKWKPGRQKPRLFWIFWDSRMMERPQWENLCRYECNSINKTSIVAVGLWIKIKSFKGNSK